jgi:glycosyltransferase involved in cell wall biosynthesis
VRVLHLIPSLAGGGAERQLSLLARALSERDLDVHVAFLHGGPNLDRMHRGDVTLHRIPAWGSYDPRVLLSVIRLVNLIKPAILQTWLLQMDVCGGIAAKLLHVPFILTERSSAGAYPAEWKWRLRSRVAGAARAVVCNSFAGVEYWQKQGFGGRILVIRNGVVVEPPRDSWSADVSEMRLLAQQRVLLFAGRFSFEKNVGRLIEAFDTVLARYADCVAVLFGEGPLKEKLAEKIQGSRSPSRFVLGEYRSDLAQWMRRATVFVSPSLFEGNPNSVLEAMAIGCPLVVSDIPQHREVLNEQSALFCSVQSSSQIASRICEVLADPQAAARRAAIAKILVNELSIASAADQYANLYRSILS